MFALLDVPPHLLKLFFNWIPSANGIAASTRDQDTFLKLFARYVLDQLGKTRFIVPAPGQNRIPLRH